MKQFRLNTLENSRKTYTRLIRAVGRDEIALDKGRALGYLFVGYLGYWKEEQNIEAMRLLEEIRDIVKGNEK